MHDYDWSEISNPTTRSMLKSLSYALKITAEKMPFVEAMAESMGFSKESREFKDQINLLERGLNTLKAFPEKENEILLSLSITIHKAHVTATAIEEKLIKDRPLQEYKGLNWLE